VRIGVIGAGRMGGALGTIFAQSGHKVLFSYARSRDKLDRLVREAGADASWGTPAEAAGTADVVLLAVHWARLDDALAQAGSLADKIVVTCCVPLNESDTELVVAHRQSGAEALAAKASGARVVAAFQTTPSEVLRPAFKARERHPRPSLVYCGDEMKSKATVATLIAAAGFDPVDAGGLRIARYIEPFAMLGAELAYGHAGGPEWVYRFARLDSLVAG